MEDMIKKIKEYKLFLAIAAIGLLLGGYFLFHRLQSSASTIPDLYQSSSSTSSKEKVQTNSSKEEKTVTSVSDAPEIITVDVKGAVKNPGVYQLQAGARVYDALQKAGGLLPDAESKSINQAQKLTDEVVVYVARVGEEGADVTQTSQTPAGNGGTEKGKSGLVNLNTATEAELQTVSGIGQKKAQDIIAYREANGKFKSVDELKNVSGIGAKTLEKLKDYVTVDK